MTKSHRIPVTLHSRGGQIVYVYTRSDAEFLRRCDEFILTTDEVIARKKAARRRTWWQRLLGHP